MFNFNQSQEDPQQALENARNVVNKGLMGGLTKAFMGQSFVDKISIKYNPAAVSQIFVMP